MSMGLASGYPMDAVITCKFRKSNLCSAVEAERLLSFTNTADPLFMFGAVAVGMFGMPELGAVIAVAHYLASFIVGITFRYHGRSRDVQLRESQPAAGNIVVRAFRALYTAKMEDRRTFGQLLGDAVKTSMNTIILIGGFIILFSVFLRILSVLGILEILNRFFVAILCWIHFAPTLAPAMVSGFFEIDLGTLAASQAIAPLIEKVSIASAIIAWSGLSVHGQVASIVIESGIKIAPYMISRLLHAVLAAVLTMVFMTMPFFTVTVSKFLACPVMFDISCNSFTFTSWLTRLEQVSYQIVLILSIMIALSIALHILRGFYLLIKNK
jgi:sporulation integral membrane protein YlbJ